MDAKTTVNKTLLIILDGFGIGEETENNAIYLAKTPNLDKLFAAYPHTTLEASGLAVGLPLGQIGNSEVGHMTIGSGCVTEQDLVRINRAIEDGSFFENPSLTFMLKKAQAANRPIHLLGLVSDGGVHSHTAHLLALIEMAKQHSCQPLLHMITDGRDTAPRRAQQFVEQIEPALRDAGGHIASVIGRYYAMDRDKRWERTQQAWEALVLGVGEVADSARQAIENAYADGLGDEFIKPTVITPHQTIQQDDRVILFNFRNDRPRQLIHALAMDDFESFERRGWGLANVATMTEIDRRLSCLIAFVPSRPDITLAKVVSDAGLQQFHCSETEKYPHITFFFNGGNEEALPGEQRKLLPSPKVATYDLQPEMSAAEVADALLEAVADPELSFIVTNFANTDMVGHTAIPAPIIKAVETVDTEVGRVVESALKHGWKVLITADHGNCDEMVDPITKEPNTQHTSNPVPCLIINHEEALTLLEGLSISSIAPTVLELMGLEIPKEMDSPSVIA